MAKIDRIVIDIYNDTQRTTLINKLMSIPLDGPIQVTIGNKTKARGLNANSYYWVRVDEIAKQAFFNGKQYSSDVWHEYLKRECMPNIVTLKDGKEVSKYVETPDGSLQVIGTSLLSVHSFAEYTQRCEQFGAELGVMFSDKRIG